MVGPTPPTARRREALSPERIVDAAIEILDRDGEAALTFKALTTQLSTGAGAIYHHVANKSELLAAATDQVIAGLLEETPAESEPTAALRVIALGIFDAIDAHPWIGAQLSRNPLPAVLRIWSAIGRQLGGLDITGPAASDAGSALVNYILGAAAQHVAGPRSAADAQDRAEYLEALAERWAEHEGDTAMPDMTAGLADHDDRDQFLAGVDIFLAGISQLR